MAERLSARDWAMQEARRTALLVDPGCCEDTAAPHIAAALRAAEERGHRAGLVEGMRRAADIAVAHGIACVDKARRSEIGDQWRSVSMWRDKLEGATEVAAAIRAEADERGARGGDHD